MRNKPGEFCVAYHGVGSTAAEPLPIVGAIMNDKKFIAGRRQACKNYNDKRHNGKKCGEGAYFTPIIKIAEGFAGNCSVCGNNSDIRNHYCRLIKKVSRRIYFCRH